MVLITDPMLRANISNPITKDLKSSEFRFNGRVSISYSLFILTKTLTNIIIKERVELLKCLRKMGSLKGKLI
jgi:hypothetical protein